MSTRLGNGFGVCNLQLNDSFQYKDATRLPKPFFSPKAISPEYKDASHTIWKLIIFESFVDIGFEIFSAFEAKAPVSSLLSPV